jgi:hypothetical protein
MRSPAMLDGVTDRVDCTRRWNIHRPPMPRIESRRFYEVVVERSFGGLSAGLLGDPRKISCQLLISINPGVCNVMYVSAVLTQRLQNQLHGGRRASHDTAASAARETTDVALRV